MSKKPKGLVFIFWLSLLALSLGACQTQGTATTTPDITAQPTSIPTTVSASTNAPSDLILFSSYRDGESELYTMSADGSNITRLTDIEERVNQPAWSPDGQWVAFVQRFDGINSEIMVMPLNKNQVENPVPSLVRLTHSSALDVEPDWSPDGTQIAFTSNRSGIMHIWVMGTNGSRRMQLTQDHHNGNHIWNSSPKWSPDGSKILYRSDVGENNEIFIMNPDGSGQRNLTQHPASDVDPAWSPDGSQIAFVSDRDGNEEIYVMNADGSNPHRLTYQVDKDTYPTWSPDGERIAFYSMREGNYEIFTMRSDSSELTQLTDHYNFDGFPAWQPTEPDISSISISFEPEESGFLPAPDPEIVSWMQKNAIPLDIAKSASENTALALLVESIGEARSVDIGNPFVGVNESLQIQKELINSLVTEKGFDTLIFDIDWLLGLKLDEYLLTGEGDPAQVLAEFPDPRWGSQEALNLIEGLRAHNQNPGDSPTIRVFGVMIPNPSQSMDEVLAYLERVDPEQRERMEKLFACFRSFEDDWGEYAYAYLSSRGECRDNIQQAYDFISNRQESYTAASSQQEFTLALKTMRGVQQAEEAYRAYNSVLLFIEENLRWVVQQRGDGAKFLLWGRNSTLGITNTQHQIYFYQFTMGRLIRPIIGEEPFSIGFSFGSGEIVALNTCVEPPQLEAISVPPTPNQSFEWLAHYAGYPAFILFLDQSNTQELGFEWLAEPIPTRLIGSQYAPALAEDYFIELDLLKTFDAMIYFDKVSPTVLLP